MPSLPLGGAAADPTLFSPVSVGVDAEGRAIVGRRETAYKTRKLRWWQRASSCGIRRWLLSSRVKGTHMPEILSLPQIMEPLIDCSRHVARTADWAITRHAICAKGALFDQKVRNGIQGIKAITCSRETNRARGRAAALPPFVRKASGGKFKTYRIDMLECLHLRR